MCSSHSVSSAASSSRIRLAERKARLEAEKRHVINIQKIEQEELSLKREELSLRQKELELKHAKSKAEIDKENLETILLEQALNEIDGHVEPTVHVTPAEPTPQTHDANQFLNFLAQQNEISRSMLSQRDQASLPKKASRTFRWHKHHEIQDVPLQVRITHRVKV